MMVIVKMSAYRIDFSGRAVRTESAFCIGSRCGGAGSVETSAVGADFGIFHKLVSALTIKGRRKHSSFPLKHSPVLFF